MKKNQRKLGQYLCKKWYSLAIFYMVLMGASFCMFDASASALTTVPTKTNFQGRLTNSAGNIMPDGLYNMKFRLFTVSSGGTDVWNETRETTNRVQVTNGLFSVRLGDVTPIPAPLFASGSLYFEVELPSPGTATCSTAACASFTEGPMTPRNQMATSAYAYNSETLDGYDSDDFGRLVANNTWSGTNLFSNSVDATGSYFHYIGGVGSDFGVVSDTAGFATGAFLIGDPSSNILFTVSGLNGTVRVGNLTSDATGTVLILDTKNTAGDPVGVSATNGAMYYNSSTSKMRCYQNGTWRDCVGTLQQGYDLSTGSTTPEIKLDSTRGGLDIQDADSTIGASLLAVRGSNGAGLGSALFNITNTGVTTFQNSSDSTAAFTIGRAGGGGSLFVADTTNSRIQVGNATADATGVVLVLDTKNSAGDPTGVDGAMYYNSEKRSFRCYQNGVWRSCMGGLVYSNTAASNTVTNTTSETNFNTTYTIPAGSCQPGKVYRVTARGIFNSANIVLGNPGTLTIRVKLGNTVVGATPAWGMGNNRQQRQWTADFNITCITYSSSGSVEGQGSAEFFTAADTAISLEMSNTSAVGGINLTTTQTLSLSAQFSTANLSNQVTLRQMAVEELGP